MKSCAAPDIVNVAAKTIAIVVRINSSALRLGVAQFACERLLMRSAERPHLTSVGGDVPGHVLHLGRLWPPNMTRGGRPSRHAGKHSLRSRRSTESCGGISSAGATWGAQRQVQRFSQRCGSADSGATFDLWFGRGHRQATDPNGRRRVRSPAVNHPVSSACRRIHHHKLLVGARFRSGREVGSNEHRSRLQAVINRIKYVGRRSDPLHHGSARF
jgi:hypothetical protein